MDRKGRFYTLTAPERDRQIVDLKNRGLSNVKIARAVGMTESGVRHAILRIREGGFGQGQAPR
jgi:DNA-binding CsgD family transcriptional regulator